MPDHDLTAAVAQWRSRLAFWTDFVKRNQIRRVAEVGVYRGHFADELLRQCPGIETYYMIDPWRNLGDWNKPANTTDARFTAIFDEAMQRTEFATQRRV